MPRAIFVSVAQRMAKPVGVGELTPLQRRRFVAAEAAIAAFSGAPVVELERFRTDVDALLDQEAVPRG